MPIGERKGIYCTGKQATQLMRFMRRYIHAVTKRKYHFNRWSMSCMCMADYWLERLQKLLGLSVALEVSPGAAIVCSTATAEPDSAI